ncbi:MAG: hypothetical protein QOJ56_3644 [Mycobacterium sp.]|jgi:hypothetical protein|nr:hypothetical protein [Mycobacterium sp.]
MGLIRRPDANPQPTYKELPGRDHFETGSPQAAGIERKRLPNRFLNSLDPGLKHEARPGPFD